MIHSARPSSSENLSSPYGPTFWLCYLANTLLMVAVSLLFRYADFVTHLGGSELNLGLIVGIGMVGAIAMRVFLGIGIDRYGPRLIWLGSLSLFIISLLAHLAVTRVDGPAVYLVRIALTISLAGAFGASITYISLRAPVGRVAEMIGVLGSSGFVGIAIGPVLGDWVFRSGTSAQSVSNMFLYAAALTLLSLICTALATRGQVRRPARRRPPTLGLLRRYHPGPLLLVAAAMGIGISLPFTFLRTYAEHLQIEHMRTYFLVYAGVAFAVRIAARRLPDRLGIRPTILTGFASLVMCMLLFLVVRSEWMLAIPAVMGGVAHAFLFPSVVSGGGASFPTRYRGLATTLMLAMFDIGNLLGQPMAGGIVEFSGRLGLPPYPTLWVTMAAGLALVGLYYTVVSRQSPAARGTTRLSKANRSDRSRRPDSQEMEMLEAPTAEAVRRCDVSADRSNSSSR
ncbi:MAG: MFS transporter [Planctomycetes bacterium]|nr:MFS transporter [Planctomycetota bacterium]